MSPAELVRIRVDGAERTISFSTDHINTTTTARAIGLHLCDLIQQRDVGDQPIQKLVLDFQEVGWISSAALNELIEVNRQARNRGVRLVLSNVQQPVHEVFVLTRLERMFELSSMLDGV